MPAGVRRPRTTRALQTTTTPQVANQPAQEQVTESSTPTRGNMQAKIGLLYVRAFVIIIGGSVLIMFAWGFFHPFSIEVFKDVLLAESSTLLGPLGFIIGYYFKEDIQNRS